MIAMKERMLDTLTRENAQNKDNLIEITADYEGRVAGLTHERN